MSRCSQVRTSAVPNLVMVSPGRMPAFSAGEPGCTAPTTAARSRNASTSAPCSRTNASSTTASSEVHHRAGDQDLEALPLRLRQELVVRAGLRIVGILAGHLDVAAERDGADAVLGVAALDLQQLRPEAERERHHAHAVPAREQEVAQLVDEHEHAEHEEERKVTSSTQVLSNSNSRASSAACIRAHASTRRTSWQRGGRLGRVRIHRLRDHPGNVRETEPALQERRYGNLVGRVQHDRQAALHPGPGAPSRARRQLSRARYASRRHGKSSQAGS